MGAESGGVMREHDAHADTALIRMLCAAAFSCEPYSLVRPVPDAVRLGACVRSRSSARGCDGEEQLDLRRLRLLLPMLPSSPARDQDALSEPQRALLRDVYALCRPENNLSSNSVSKSGSSISQSLLSTSDITDVFLAIRQNAERRPNMLPSCDDCLAQSLRELARRFPLRVFRVGNVHESNTQLWLHSETALAFHGSNAENWYSILHGGLRESAALSDFRHARHQPRTQNGQVYGAGVYLTRDAMTAAQFAPVGAARWSCIALVEYIDCDDSAPSSSQRVLFENDAKPSSYVVVPLGSMTRLRFLLFFGDGAAEHPGWLERVAQSECGSQCIRAQSDGRLLAPVLSFVRGENILVLALLAYVIMLLWSSDYRPALLHSLARLFP
mmetsp:Transcript_10566/g.28124  ORF Transcript_10566/g.28124 Transcript_10566/m.28124 type:complete len:385 (+) Transcript_10566:39-1193(+)